MSDWLFTLRVDGIPCAKGSPMAFLANRKQVTANPHARPRINVREGRSKEAYLRYTAWTSAIYKAALDAIEMGQECNLDGPLVFSARFYLPRPKSKKKAVYADTGLDYDKLVRCVWDELQRAGVIKNDARFVRFGEPNGKFYETGEHPPGVWLGIRSAEIRYAI